MTSYLSSLTSHYNSIKKLLPTHLAPEADNSINDPADSHVSRVLRAYYTEKGRPFPPWLGPDPNAPVKAQPTYMSQPRLSTQSAPSPGLASSRRGGGLGDLFGDSPATPTTIPQEEPLSLRSRRGAIKAQTPLTQAPAPIVRPMPSQRQGSYQSRNGDSYGGGSAVKEQTAQERLRARLGGSRSQSPAATPSPSANFDSRSSRDAYNPYETAAGGFNPYESSGGYNPYETGSKTPYSSSGSSSRPYAGSNSPWSTGDDPADIGSGTGRRGPGLPSNPRARR